MTDQPLVDIPEDAISLLDKPERQPKQIMSLVHDQRYDHSSMPDGELGGAKVNRLLEYAASKMKKNNWEVLWVGIVPTMIQGERCVSTMTVLVRY